jgi:hypothetical protein
VDRPLLQAAIAHARTRRAGDVRVSPLLGIDEPRSAPEVPLRPDGRKPLALVADDALYIRYAVGRLLTARG